MSQTKAIVLTKEQVQDEIVGRRLSLKLAKEETRRELSRESIELLKQLMASPLFQLLGFCAGVELLQKAGILSDFLGSTLEGVVVTGKSLELLSSGIGSVVNPLSEITGALAPLFKGAT